MRLLRVEVHRIGPFDAASLSFTNEAVSDVPEPDPLDALEIGAAPAPEAPPPTPPRPLTLLFGGDGTGKTSLLAAIAGTRPGNALPPLPPLQQAPRAGEASPHIATEWLLGDDDPARPHPLVVASPSAILRGETAETAALRRREQAIFDRRAQQEGGHVFVSFSGARWFSRVANMLSVPDRSILRYDVRQPGASFDDPTRADLTRETKQILSYAAIARALGAGRAEFEPLARFDAALREVLDLVLEPFDLTYDGVSPTTLEPQARSTRGGLVSFDSLPRAARHLMALVALPLRALSAAYPGAETPREREGVVAIDDADSQQDSSVVRMLGPLLRRALPNVQWILASSSTQLALACDPSEVVALRRVTADHVELGAGHLH